MTQSYDFEWKIFENTNKWVTQADAKATGLLATDAVIAGMIFTHLDKIIPAIKMGVIIQYLSLLGVLLLIASVYFALRCLTPRLSVGEPNSVIFFQHIASMSVVDYAAKLQAVTPAGQTEQIVHQIWANARVAAAKHRMIIYGIRCFKAAAFAFLLPLICYVDALL